MPVYVAAGGPVVAKYAGRVGDGFICTSGKGMELYTDKLLPAVAEGCRQGRRPVDAIDQMIEMKVSFDPDRERALRGHPLLGAARAPAEEKTGVEDPLEMAHAADELPIEQVAAALDRLHRPRGASSTPSGPTRRRLRPPGLPRARPRPAAAS